VYNWIRSHHSGKNVAFLKSPLKTGDILFTRPKTWKGTLMTSLLGSFVQHCAMIVILDGKHWVWGASPSLGAHLISLKSFLKKKSNLPYLPHSVNLHGQTISYVPKQSMYESHVYVRRLQNPVDETKIKQFIYDNLGKPYSFRSYISGFHSIFGIQIPFTEDFSHLDSSMYCSELVAATLKDYIKENSTTLLPMDFWENKISWRDQTLLDPEEILLDFPENEITSANIFQDTLQLVENLHR